ncbi:MAG: zf-HC2 domain-containing protein [Syntrophomonas sp.]
MECNFDKELLHEYLDHELDPLLTIILDEHLAVCPECRKELNQLKILDWDLRFADQFEIPGEQLKELRTRTLDRCFADEEKDQSSLLDLYRVQTHAASYAVNYVQYIPGSSLLKKTGQVSQQILLKTLGLNKLLPAARR